MAFAFVSLQEVNGCIVYVSEGGRGGGINIKAQSQTKQKLVSTDVSGKLMDHICHPRRRLEKRPAGWGETFHICAKCW